MGSMMWNGSSFLEDNDVTQVWRIQAEPQVKTSTKGEMVSLFLKRWQGRGEYSREIVCSGLIYPPKEDSSYDGMSAVEFMKKNAKKGDDIVIVGFLYQNEQYLNLEIKRFQLVKALDRGGSGNSGSNSDPQPPQKQKKPKTKGMFGG